FLEMFGDPIINQKKLNIVELNELTNLITYGLTVRPKYVTEGIPLISAKEIRTGKTDFNDAAIISHKDFEVLSEKCKPKQDELLLSKTGAIGHCAIVQTDRTF